ncbi:hypothetical protein ACFSKS_07545 [Pseudocitrobacter faecalis]
MVKIYTLTFAPSLDSATQTPQIYPEGNYVVAHLYLSPAVVVSTSPARLRF